MGEHYKHLGILHRFGLWVDHKRLENYAYESQRFVDAEGVNANDGFAGLYPIELFELGKNILSCSNLSQVSDFLAQNAINGKTFYDQLIGIQHKRAHDILRYGLSELEEEIVTNGLDVGAGTGDTALVLAPHCKNLVAVDLSEKMLEIARKKINDSGYNVYLETYQMDVRQLDLPHDRFDVVLEQGVDSYLSKNEFVNFLLQVRDVLVIGGRFYKYQIDNKSSIYTGASARTKLVREVVKHALSFSSEGRKEDGLISPDWKNLGFAATFYSFDSNNGEGVLQMTKI